MENLTDVKMRQQIRPAFRVPLLLYAMFLCASIVDPGGGFGLKYLASLLLSFYALVCIFTGKITFPLSFLVLEIPLFLLAPIFYLLLSVGIFLVPVGNAVSEITPFLTWVLYPVLLRINDKRKIVAIFRLVMFFGAVLITTIFFVILLAHFTGHDGLVGRINFLANRYRLGYLGRNPLGGRSVVFVPNVYFRWSLLLIPATLLMLQESTAKSLFMVFAALLTSSTAIIFFTFAGLGWVFVDSVFSKSKHSKTFRKRAALSVLLLFGIILALYMGGYQEILAFVLEKFSARSQSTVIKVGHIRSVLDVLSEDSFRLLFGMGVGSSFYSIGVGRFVSNIEVDHFNLIRQFGLMYATAFFLYVLFNLVALWKLGDETGKLIAMGLLLLFIAAGTNPLLISPVFFLQLILSRAYIALSNRERELLMAQDR